MSTKSQNAVPASLRRPVERLGQAQGSPARSARPVLLPGLHARAAALAASCFARLPEEPEDARMTGVTRSLNRRLLALNVSGRLMKGAALGRPKIA